MKIFHVVPSAILLVVLSASSASAQQRTKLAENAALRYWSAFAQMQDSAITEHQAKELNAILDGTAPYDDSKYRELVEKNRPALETMARGTALANCDWGVDSELGADAPVDYVRKALTLGRLNVLYAFHRLINGDKDGAAHTLAAGFHFSQDAASGGTLFATVVAKTLVVVHLRAVQFAMQLGELSAAQRLVLQKAVAQLGPDGLDWQSAVKRELQVLRGADSQTSAALARIIPAYVAALHSPTTLPKLQEMISNAPRPLAEVIPNPKRVLEEKQDLTERLAQVGARLQ